MNISEKGIELIKRYETLRLTAYLCPAGVPTVGWGTTIYPNGSRVKLGDVISKDYAQSCFEHDIKRFVYKVDAFTTDKVNQNQFDALVSFAYNVGDTNLKKSTLLKLVNENPKDFVRIRAQFLKWCYADGVKFDGLIERRAREANLYQLA